MASHILRRCVFSPYRKGMGPTFGLTTWDAGEREDGSLSGRFSRRQYLGYRLTMRAPGPRGKAVCLFEGEDFGMPAIPMQGDSIDGDNTIRGIMGFLTLKPGDTDDEYFERYTPEQLAYTEQHAEALRLEVMNRFGEV
jgi:hypothetical protein